MFAQAAAAERELTAAQQLWDHLEEELSQLTTKTSRSHLSLGLHQPQICLQAHADLHQQLQVGPAAISCSLLSGHVT